ncbi:MAG: tetratricopeptide repeat protein, partial [Gemmatimonadetes bacterium]|nr:tetratricopeptide repeat protein [Gemmatimonadota bacterium]
RDGQRYMKREDYDRAVLKYSKAVALKPGNARYEVALQRAKLRSSSEHFNKGKLYYASGQLELAIAEFQQTLVLNPANQHAENELEKAARELQRKQVGPSALEQLKERARRKQLGPPKLDPRSNIPILLNFQEVEVGKIFEAISKASGINFIYDEKVELDRPRTIDIGNVTLEKALDIL